MRNMGLRYLLFRLKHELLMRSGLLARQFPVSPAVIKAPSLPSVLVSLEKWPWQAKESFKPVKKIDHPLAAEVDELLQGRILLFQTIPYQLQNRHEWHRHPETGFVYDKNLHWTQISDSSPKAGDIKFVWERGRFSQLQTMMRFDLQTGSNHSAWVFEEIESWIDNNLPNCGPHYRCSQEISLRVMNWLGAISFYRNSTEFTEARWQKIWQSLYWQVHHVRKNIDFSRIAVRNNHAITETLMLYIFGTLFPDAPGCREWKDSGKRWFEEEIAYQIYPDGSYLQFSMNYHRVVIQLLTLAFRFAENAGDSFSRATLKRARASLDFLRFFQDPVSGWMPNYGANDGALFFRFTANHFRDYRPQLEALACALGNNSQPLFEDALWFGISRKQETSADVPENGIRVFQDGGFAGIRTDDSVLMLRCGRHKDRPSQADNLHMDLWVGGENLLRDAGTYKYNADAAMIRYFFGTRSHNTLMIEDNDQMLKGPRFVWFHWSQATFLQASESDEFYEITGEISAFAQLAKGIRHRRSIRAFKNRREWEIADSVNGHGNRRLTLNWHPGRAFFDSVQMEVQSEAAEILEPETVSGWYSEFYGKKEPAQFLSYSTSGNGFLTRIIWK